MDSASRLIGNATETVRNNTVLLIIVQLCLGVLVVIIAYFIALGVLREDNLTSNTKANLKDPKQKTLIMDGWMDSNNLHGRRFSTVNHMSASYIPMPRSYNRNGGSQFSYSFWMFMSGEAAQSNVRNKDILIKGDIREYKYERLRTEAGKDTVIERESDILIKCPRLRFGESFSDLVLEFNTHDNINQKIYMNSQEHGTDLSIRHNLMAIMLKKWVLFTLTFEDNVPINDFENGIVVRLFVNDLLYYTHRISSTLRQNHGDLFLFPSGDVTGCRIADLAYYNYAIGFKQICHARSLFHQIY